MRVAAAIIAMAGAGCTHRPSPPITPQVTVYFCKAGSDMLVPMPFSVDRSLQGSKLESALVAQLLSGPAVPTTAVVLFPNGTAAAVDVAGDLATVNFTGAISK